MCPISSDLRRVDISFCQIDNSEVSSEWGFGEGDVAWGKCIQASGDWVASGTVYREEQMSSVTEYETRYKVS